MNLKNLVQQYDKLQLLDDFIKFKYEPRFKKKLLGEISNIIHNNINNENNEGINKEDIEIKDEKEKIDLINNEEDYLNLKQEKEKKVDLNNEEIITTFEALNNPSLNKQLIKSIHEIKRKINLRSIKMLNNNVIIVVVFSLLLIIILLLFCSKLFIISLFSSPLLFILFS